MFGLVAKLLTNREITLLMGGAFLAGVLFAGRRYETLQSNISTVRQWLGFTDAVKPFIQAEMYQAMRDYFLKPIINPQSEPDKKTFYYLYYPFKE